MEWVREGACLPPAQPGEADALRAWRPWVVQDGETLSMWYSGHDGTTWRILHATGLPDATWERRGVVIEPGLAGETDDYGVQSPCVVRTRGGFLMTYTGFDGELNRLHMASSMDGASWTPLGTFLHRGDDDQLGASHPSILVTGLRWWLFFAGVGGPQGARHSSIVAAVSENGASWDRIGAVLGPSEGELSVSNPCVIEHEREFEMFYASDDGRRTGIALATSRDGVNWDRRGLVLPPAGDGDDGLETQTPCVVRLSDGSYRMWYAGLPIDDTQHGYRICTARLESR